ncbi:13527_t:CDS:2 [Rhizophagus irregularis]|nr:13527_t:CDS:2 [Rhizophagus irregularis]
MSYGKRDLLKILANRAYYSPEVSETEDEGSKSVINVYDLSWRSEELKLLLRNILDKHVRVGQTVKQLRSRNYDDKIQCYDKVPPDDAPDWSYIDQLDMVYNTEYTDDLNIDDENLDAILEDKADKSESFMQED